MLKEQPCSGNHHGRNIFSEEQVIHEPDQITSVDQLVPGPYIVKQLKENGEIKETPIQVIAINPDGETIKTDRYDEEFLADRGIMRGRRTDQYNAVNWLVPADSDH